MTSFYSDLGALNLEVDPRLDLSHSLFKGCSFRLKNTSDDHASVAANKISEMSKVRKVWPVRQRRLPNSKVIATSDGRATGLNLGRQNGVSINDTFSPHVMTQVDKLRAQGITGAGIRIGVIDTGVDYNRTYNRVSPFVVCLRFCRSFAGVKYLDLFLSYNCWKTLLGASFS